MTIRIFEGLIILWALYTEVTNFLKKDEGRFMTEPVPVHGNVFTALTAFILAIAYAVVAVVWIFSPVYHVRAAGIILCTLSGIGWSLDKSGGRPTWYTKFDAIVSLGCLCLVIEARIRGMI